VWGYDYFGGTRTVDVHVRRLRAKLGTEHEALIGTVRNVGYRFVPLKGSEDGRRGPAREAAPATGSGGTAGQRDADAADGAAGPAADHATGTDRSKGADRSTGAGAATAADGAVAADRATAADPAEDGGTAGTHRGTRRIGAARAER
jgi:hypothetical protein